MDIQQYMPAKCLWMLKHGYLEICNELYWVLYDEIVVQCACVNILVDVEIQLEKYFLKDFLRIIHRKK